MGKMIIEYRYKASCEKNGRRNTSEMRYYLEGLVDEMRSAGISAEYIDSVATDETNSVIINGKDVLSVLEGLEIRIPESDDCDPEMRPNMVILERPVTDWDMCVIEDIPDVLMKNAISKVYADMNR